MEMVSNETDKPLAGALRAVIRRQTKAQEILRIVAAARRVREG